MKRWFFLQNEEFAYAKDENVDEVLNAIALTDISQAELIPVTCRRRAHASAPRPRAPAPCPAAASGCERW